MKDTAPACPELLQAAFGEIDVLDVGQMLDDGLANVKRFGAACALGEILKPRLRYQREGE